MAAAAGPTAVNHPVPAALGSELPGWVAGSRQHLLFPWEFSLEFYAIQHGTLTGKLQGRGKGFTNASK